MHNNDLKQKKDFITYLQSRISANKLQKMEEILHNRTKHVTVLLENLFQERNVSAIVRSVECLGIQDVHLVQDKYMSSIAHGIAVGSAKWISMYNHINIASAYRDLKNKGYRIVATTPADNSILLESLPLEKKLVFVFGTEETGLSEYALEHADEYVRIPMYGFTQSFNVGISAGLCMYYVTQQLRSSSIAWQLSEDEKCDVMIEWLRQNIRGFNEFERMFFQT